VLELNDPDAECMIDFTYCIGARLRGLSLVGRNLGQGVHGMLTRPRHTRESRPRYGADFPTIERCIIRGFTGNALDMAVECMNVRSSAFGYNAGDGLNYRGADAMVIDNWISNNGGVGIRATEGTGSSTFTANRIEWNRGGNMVVRNAWGWNVTRNSFDRAGGPSLFLQGNCNDFTITGNVFLRSGALLRGTGGGNSMGVDRSLPEFDRCAVRIEGARGLVFTGNLLTVGGNDAGSRPAPNTPEYGAKTPTIQGKAVYQSGCVRDL